MNRRDPIDQAWDRGPDWNMPPVERQRQARECEALWRRVAREELRRLRLQPKAPRRRKR